MSGPAPRPRRRLNIATLMVAVAVAACGLGAHRVIGAGRTILVLLNLPMAVAAWFISARVDRRMGFTRTQFGVYYVTVLILCVSAVWAFLIPVFIIAVGIFNL